MTEQAGDLALEQRHVERADGDLAVIVHFAQPAHDDLSVRGLLRSERLEAGRVVRVAAGEGADGAFRRVACLACVACLTCCAVCCCGELPGGLDK